MGQLEVLEFLPGVYGQAFADLSAELPSANAGGWVLIIAQFVVLLLLRSLEVLQFLPGV
jgi:hypothetical protein